MIFPWLEKIILIFPGAVGTLKKENSLFAQHTGPRRTSLMLRSHQAKAKANFSLIFDIAQCE